MSGRAGPLLLPIAAALVLFLASGVIGYVYSHEPARDTLVVAYEGTPPPSPTYVIGAIATVEGGTLRLDVGAGGQREVVLASGVPVEALERTGALPEDGTSVNVGVDDTDFGLVLTGVVTVEGAR